MNTGRQKTPFKGLTTTQTREVLADMLKGGNGHANGVIYEEEQDGKRCFVFTQDNGRFAPTKCICDTYEQAQKIINIGTLGV